MHSGAARERFAGAALVEDEGLCSRLRKGDPAALDQLWQRFGPRLLAFAATRLDGDEESAEDVMVQSLAAAVRSIGSFDPRKSALSAWVYGIARRVLQGELRKQRTRKSVPISAQIPLEARPALATGAGEQDLPARMEAARKVRVLASSLSHPEMEVLVLHFVDEFSVKEIAQITRRSWRGVDSLLHRAKRKARERLAQDGD